MSYADQVFIQNCKDILSKGVWDTDLNVRPRWEDGTPAHTVKKFGIVNRYDLREEFPILTLRRTYLKTCIDELPQLFNVLKGDMSLIGPRPERPYWVEQFKEEIPRYMIKHQVRPGMSGWAQVNGYRGDTSIEKRIEYDLYYIENWTFAFDLRIVFLTVFKGFINKNAY